MLAVSPVRVAVSVPAPTDVHAAPAWLPLYHQAVLWPVRVSVAPVWVMPEAVRAGAARVVNSASVAAVVSSVAQVLSENAL